MYRRKYTPQPKPCGYDKALHRRAIRPYMDGMGLRRIAQHLEVVRQTIVNWIVAYAATLPGAPSVPPHDRRRSVSIMKLDELYTFEEQ